VAKAEFDGGGDAAVEKDMFGNPVLPIRERRGRPSYAKTPENQRFVETRAADGWSQEMIAQDMGIDADTLRKHFSAELECGLVKLKGEMLDILRQQARKGHVPSVRELLARVDRTAPRAVKPKEPRATSPKVLTGKKEARVEAAQETPTGYGDIFDKMKQAH
jgi:hypothetical protein